MPEDKNCTNCKGEGSLEVLTSQHDDKKETIKCKVCGGSGTIHQMTDEEERDYWEDYW